MAPVFDDLPQVEELTARYDRLVAQGRRHNRRLTFRSPHVGKRAACCGD